MDAYEQVVVKLFEYCGFTYEPGPEPDTQRFYASEIVPMPYAEFSEKKLPWEWMRSVALHLHDTRRGCAYTCRYIAEIPAFLRAGEAAVTKAWLDGYFAANVCGELRAHVFWFLTPSDTIRDTIMSEIDETMPTLIPDPPTNRYKRRLDVKTLSRQLAGRNGLSRSDAEWLIQELSDLDLHCRITLGAIKKLISEPEADQDTLIQRFTNTQAAFLDLAQVLLGADVAVRMWEQYAIDFERPD